MKDRLQQLMTSLNLTATRLADDLKIQRSGISHILSGRNQPSFDFLNRILTKYPAINARWLILGEGSMNRESEVRFNTEDQVKNITNSKPDTEGNNTKVTNVNTRSDITGVLVLKSDGTFEHYKQSGGD